MDEEKLATELGLSPEDLKDPAKVKEAAEKVEAENKAAKEEVGNKGGDQENKILNDQLGRLAKALEKRNSITKEPVEKQEAKQQETLSELDVDNRVFMRSEKLTPEQVSILNEYAKLPKNEGKSFEEIYGSSAVKAEMADLKSKQDAADELDANADEEKNLETKNEIYDKYSKTGESPKTDYEKKIIAEKSLEEEGFREF